MPVQIRIRRTQPKVRSTADRPPRKPRKARESETAITQRIAVPVGASWYLPCKTAAEFLLAAALLVRPGVTGLAQVQLPADTELASVRRKLMYDLHYVRHFGLGLDFRILGCTILHAAGVPLRIGGRLFSIPDCSIVEGMPPPAVEHQPRRSKKVAA